MPEEGAPRPSRLRRLLRGARRSFVPSLVAAHAAGFVGSAFDGPGGPGALAALAFAGAFAAVWAGRAWLLRRGWGPPAWGLVLTLWVVVHLCLGLSAAEVRSAGPVPVPSVAAWGPAPVPFLAGTGEGAFRLTADDAIAGWGQAPRRDRWPWFVPGPLGRAVLAAMARPGPDGRPAAPLLARGQPGPDALGARALCLRPAQGPGAPFAVVRLDLVLVDPVVRERVLAGVADLGFADETLWVVATHTHSGPGGWACATLAQVLALDHLREEVRARIVRAAVEAIRSAHASAVPCRLGFVRARDLGPDGRPALARNRSDPDPDAVDPEVLGLRFDALDGSRRVALLLNYAVHPTWGRSDDLVFRRDVAGALEDDPRIADGARTVFVNGALGDVKPRVRPPWEPGAPGDPLAPFARAVAADLAAPASSDRVRVVAALARRDLGSGRAVHDLLGSRAALLADAEGPWGRGLGGAAAAGVLLPANALLWCAGATDVRLVGSWRGGLGVVLGLDPWLHPPRRSIEPGAEAAGPVPRFPVGCLRLETPEGSAALLAMPGEPTAAVGLALKGAARGRGARPAFVLGLANDHMAYFGTPGQCDAGTYEGRMTLFGRETADRVVETAERVLEAAGFAAPGR